MASGVVLGAEDVVVTDGGIEAPSLVSRAVARPGDTIAVESPSFYGLLQILGRLAFR